MKGTKSLNYLTKTGKLIPVETADSFIKRLLGLMGRSEGCYGLLLERCNSIHTCFMRYNMDAIFLDDNNRVLAIKRSIKPFSFILPIKRAKKVLEFPSVLQAAAFLLEGSPVDFS